MRAVVAIVLVVGLISAVAELRAERPPTRDAGIPIYFGDPGDIYPNSRERHPSEQEQLLEDDSQEPCLVNFGIFKIVFSRSGGDGKYCKQARRKSVGAMELKSARGMWLDGK